MAKLGDWLREIRVPFLTLPVALVFLGSSAAAYDGYFNIWRALVALVGLLATHISVNVLNEYSDYKRGIDFDTVNTPFSGGTKMLVEGRVQAKSALIMGIFTLVIGIIVGVFFVWLTGIWLLPVLILGVVSIVLYTDLFARTGFGELFAGLGLGLLPVLGAYFVQTENYGFPAWAAGIPPGILTANLLLLNEFPDVEADRKGGRKNLILMFGRKPAGMIYTLTLVFMYIWIIAMVVTRVIPVYCLVSLLTIAIAIKPMKWALAGGTDQDNLLPALGANVIVNHVTQILLGIGFITAIYL
jgi:1,4-dihydroxy-2-naphthoate octaprenyltransferase